MSGVEVTATAPGKVNLYFAVGDVQSDGYHPVASLYAAVSLREVVVARVSEQPGIALSMDVPEDSVLAQMEANGDFDRDSVPLDERNLAYKAAVAVLEAQGLSSETRGMHLQITKNVPVAGGMAGGSADAAATLKAVNQLIHDAGWVDAALDTDELMRLASGLGADVPFCLLGGFAVGYGTGTELTPVEAPYGGRALHVVMVLNTRGLSTPEVFAELDRGRAEGRYRAAGKLEVPETLIEALLNTTDLTTRLTALAAALRNDLGGPALALAPELVETVNLQDDSIVAGFVSGSGPTVALLMRSEEGAQRLVAELAKQRRYAIAVKLTH